ncbi:hypothetical protein EDD18DRAFT_850648 [Armillaria luteobubalina]|uniref:Uncharacterized protein n=1 Tax=Armillaria luteobubalina TaxID=153913 RepID=A0AA39QC53_9AGAR|nr:hypothetical protein EDD18DRAFT_850648 [Armillaria luteobubalina]
MIFIFFLTTGLLDAFKDAQCWLTGSADRRPSLTPTLKLQLAPPETFHSLRTLLEIDYASFYPWDLIHRLHPFSPPVTQRYQGGLISLDFPHSMFRHMLYEEVHRNPYHYPL